MHFVTYLHTFMHAEPDRSTFIIILHTIVHVQMVTAVGSACSLTMHLNIIGINDHWVRLCQKCPNSIDMLKNMATRG